VGASHVLRAKRESTFCARHGVRPEIQKITMTNIDDAWSNIVDRKARYRFVVEIDGCARRASCSQAQSLLESAAVCEIP